VFSVLAVIYSNAAHFPGSELASSDIATSSDLSVLLESTSPQISPPLGSDASCHFGSPHSTESPNPSEFTSGSVYISDGDSILFDLRKNVLASPLFDSPSSRDGRPASGGDALSLSGATLSPIKRSIPLGTLVNATNLPLLSPSPSYSLSEGKPNGAIFNPSSGLQASSPPKRRQRRRNHGSPQLHNPDFYMSLAHDGETSPSLNPAYRFPKAGQIEMKMILQMLRKDTDDGDLARDQAMKKLHRQTFSFDSDDHCSSPIISPRRVIPSALDRSPALPTPRQSPVLSSFDSPTCFHSSPRKKNLVDTSFAWTDLVEYSRDLDLLPASQEDLSLLSPNRAPAIAIPLLGSGGPPRPLDVSLTWTDIVEFSQCYGRIGPYGNGIA
jgi:hypothetical protein